MRNLKIWLRRSGFELEISTAIHLSKGVVRPKLRTREVLTFGTPLVRPPIR